MGPRYEYDVAVPAMIAYPTANLAIAGQWGLGLRPDIGLPDSPFLASHPATAKDVDPVHPRSMSW